MSVDFFNTPCKEPALTNMEFGICDDQDGTKAYTSVGISTNWIATVINKTQIEVSFTSIDNCIIVLKEGTLDKESSCDGMLTFSNNVYLIELKNQRTGGWLPDAIDQLKNSIKLLKANNNLGEIRYKKAYACNRKHPNFQVIQVERKRKFYDETGFRIDAQAEIVIK
jgi:hypothetical protein